MPTSRFRILDVTGYNSRGIITLAIRGRITHL